VRIIASTPAAVLVVDRDGIVELRNDSTEALFGYPRNEAVRLAAYDGR
jgi:PAS domain S-box-containing protein